MSPRVRGGQVGQQRIFTTKELIVNRLATSFRLQSASDITSSAAPTPFGAWPDTLRKGSARHLTPMRKPSLRRRKRLGRQLRTWAPYGVVALALLASSQMLWRWQTWPVRDLIVQAAGAGP